MARELISALDTDRSDYMRIYGRLDSPEVARELLMAADVDRRRAEDSPEVARELLEALRSDSGSKSLAAPTADDSGRATQMTPIGVQTEESGVFRESRETQVVGEKKQGQDVSLIVSLAVLRIA